MTDPAEPVAPAPPETEIERLVKLTQPPEYWEALLQTDAEFLRSMGGSGSGWAWV